MASILDHVEQSVPRSTVYGAMKGSPVFIGKYFREINPSSNQTTYDYTSGEKRIVFVVASPDKTIFHDMRSVYLRTKIECLSALDVSGGTSTGNVSVAEPASNIIERIVIKMNGTVVEDISRFDHLTSFFKRKLLSRDQKNARNREGWDFVTNDQDAARTAINSGLPGKRDGVLKNATLNNANDELCLKLDLSGILKLQQLLSGYYSPLEIELYLQDPKLCGVRANSAYGNTIASGTVLATWECTKIKITNPRLCIDQIVMSPEYVSAFEAALLANSAAQGIQIPFQTYYNYTTDIENEDVTFWVRKPVRYLRSVYWGGIASGGSGGVEDDTAALSNGTSDAYNFTRITPSAATGTAGPVPNANGSKIFSYQVAIGTKSYRAIEDGSSDAWTAASEVDEKTAETCNESDFMFAKAVGQYNDYDTESAEYQPFERRFTQACQGIDLEFSPDNDVLASETTLNSNDIRLRIRSKKLGNGGKFRIFVFTAYQASIALFPGNETRLLVT